MAKRLKPLEKYLRNCLWCSLPYVQKNPEQLYCCPAHAAKGRKKEREAATAITGIIQSNPVLSEFVDRCLDIGLAPIIEFRDPPSVEPPGLTGLDLLTWRNEQRK